MPRNPDKINYSGGLPDRFESFEIIEDPRSGGNTLHNFGEILFMAVSAMLCGMNGFAEIDLFCEKQVEWLGKWITLPHGILRAQTFSNVFQIIDPDLFKAKGWSISQELEKSHGRITKRTVLTTTNLTWMEREMRDRWPQTRTSLLYQQSRRQGGQGSAGGSIALEYREPMPLGLGPRLPGRPQLNPRSHRRQEPRNDATNRGQRPQR